MTRKEKQKAINAIKISAPVMAITQEEFKDYIQTLNKIMDWLEQEPCDKCVYSTKDDCCQYDDIAGTIPPVTPQPKTGKWEWGQYSYNPKFGNWHCSECRSVVVECVGKEEKGGIPLYKYCPQCGAKMQEAESEGEHG